MTNKSGGVEKGELDKLAASIHYGQVGEQTVEKVLAVLKLSSPEAVQPVRREITKARRRMAKAIARSNGTVSFGHF